MPDGEPWGQSGGRESAEMWARDFPEVPMEGAGELGEAGLGLANLQIPAASGTHGLSLVVWSWLWGD